MNHKNPLQKGIQSIKNVSLSREEKDSMLKRLTAYVDERPVLMQPVKHNPFAFLSVQFRAYKSAYAFVFAAMLVIVGGQISYAAEQALPGDLLYPVKIHVNEAVQGALKVTPEAAAQWEERKIEKRLEEVHTLVEKGKFDTPKRKQVEKEIEKTVDTLRRQNKKDENFEKKIDDTFKKINQKNKDKTYKTNGLKDGIEKDTQEHEVELLEQEIKSKLHKSDKNSKKNSHKVSDIDSRGRSDRD